jgi:hypothetical protein
VLSLRLCLPRSKSIFNHALLQALVGVANFCFIIYFLYIARDDVRDQLAPTIAKLHKMVPRKMIPERKTSGQGKSKAVSLLKSKEKSLHPELQRRLTEREMGYAFQT